MTALFGLPAATTLASVALSLLPVIAFLAGLYAPDSFKLLRWRTVGLCLMAGCIGAIAGMQLNAAVVSGHCCQACWQQRRSTSSTTMGFCRRLDRPWSS